MYSLTGTFWKSAPTIGDPHFEDTILLIVSHDITGSVGLILNQPYHRRFNELVEFKDYPPLPIYIGGPVDQEHLFLLHKDPELVPGGMQVTKDWFYGGDFKVALTNLKNGSLDPVAIQLYLGYSGWDALQLEEEIEEGSWITCAPPNRFI